MKFLIDGPLSPVVATEMSRLGYDAVHIRYYSLTKSGEQKIFGRAYTEQRILVSADTDFRFFFSEWTKNKPSVIILGEGISRDPFEQARILDANLKGELLAELEKGSLVIMEQDKIRIKSLPLYRLAINANGQ